MTEFTELLEGFQRDGDAWTVTVSDDWLQGRTVYGGLGAALCLEATQRSIPDLPPLRSAQVSFAGPATGRLRIQSSVLRRGKSTVFASTDLSGDDGFATRAMLCFGAARPSSVSVDTVSPQTPAPPDQCPPFFKGAPPFLHFLQHIEGKSAGQNLPFSGAAEPDMTIWLRHRDPALKPSLVALLALADAPPPAWEVALPDLRSRLAATPHVAILAPDDALIAQLIVKLLGDRGIAVSTEIADYLVPRIERSYVAVLNVVDILDQAMLSHHRRMTVPLARRALEDARMVGRSRINV